MPQKNSPYVQFWKQQLNAFCNQPLPDLYLLHGKSLSWPKLTWIRALIWLQEYITVFGYKNVVLDPVRGVCNTLQHVLHCPFLIWRIMNSWTTSGFQCFRTVIMGLSGRKSSGSANDQYSSVNLQLHFQLGPFLERVKVFWFLVITSLTHYWNESLKKIPVLPDWVIFQCVGQSLHSRGVVGFWWVSLGHKCTLEVREMFPLDGQSTNWEGKFPQGKDIATTRIREKELGDEEKKKKKKSSLQIRFYESLNA